MRLVLADDGALDPALPRTIVGITGAIEAQTVDGGIDRLLWSRPASIR